MIAGSGNGLFVRIVLQLSPGGVRRLCRALKEHGVLAKNTHGHFIRLALPLVVRKEDQDWALEHIEEVLIVP